MSDSIFMEQDAIFGSPLIEPLKLIWTDPPFGTGKVQSQGDKFYKDDSDTSYVIDCLRAWVPALASLGTMVVLCDYRLAYKLQPALVDAGLTHRGDVIWEFGLGRPRMSWWPNRHNIMMTFTRDEGHFDPAAIPRVKRLAKSPGYPDDKPAGSVWDYTMSNSSAERVGYPNQKPLAIIEPFVLAHTSPGDLVGDPFCGSGSTAIAALMHGRRFVGCDINPQAIEAAQQRRINYYRGAQQ